MSSTTYSCRPFGSKPTSCRGAIRACGSRRPEPAVIHEAYVRESILNPYAKIAAGYQPIMPTFPGLFSEEQLLELVEYVKSLQNRPEALTARPPVSAPGPAEDTPANPAVRR